VQGLGYARGMLMAYLPKEKILARELTGFLWAALTQ
jgi:hypothetical protein